MPLSNKITFNLLLACLTVASAQAQYAAEVFPVPLGERTAQISAGRSGQQFGTVASGYAAANIWNGIQGGLINLNNWRLGSTIFAAYGTYQGGSANVTSYTTSGSGRGGGGSRTYLIPHAIQWHGSAGSSLDLNPRGMYESSILGMSSFGQVGWASSGLFSSPHAFYWKGSVTSAVDLNPESSSSSIATAASGQFQCGSGLIGSTNHALLWNGTAQSAIDLHPPQLAVIHSYANSLDSVNGQQAGSVDVGVSGAPLLHACLWSGTAASAVDLHPTSFASSAATAVLNGLQAGYAVTASNERHAMLWKGTSMSALDLNTLLPTRFISSCATGFDVDGSIVGYGSDGTYTYALVWRPTNTQYVSGTQDVQPGTSGWATSNVLLTITSPFGLSTTSISYTVDSQPTTTVTGDSVQLNFDTTASHRISASARHGAISTPLFVYTLNLDLSPPATTFSYAKSLLTLTASDIGSGVATTFFTLDGGTTSVFKSPLVLANQTHLLTYWSVDLAGNIEASHKTTLQAISPVLSSLSPSEVLSGGSGFQMIVGGSGFNTNSVINWNGSPRTTTFDSSSKLEVAISASDIANAGSAKITVTNPAPGVGTSAPLSCTIDQMATAVGAATNSGDGTTFDLSPISSYAGFTLAGNSVHIATSAATVFLDSSGNSMTASAFFDQIEDGQTIQATGTFTTSTQTILAQIVQFE